MTGKIKFIKIDKGYGFIIPDDSMVDVFFHVSALENGKENYKAGNMVYYEVEDGRKGQQAINIKLQ